MKSMYTIYETKDADKLLRFLKDKDIHMDSVPSIASLKEDCEYIDIDYIYNVCSIDGNNVDEVRIVKFIDFITLDIATIYSREGA